jgi:hypothetical protein
MASLWTGVCTHCEINRGIWRIYDLLIFLKQYIFSLWSPLIKPYHQFQIMFYVSPLYTKKSLINSMEQSPFWELNIRLDKWEIPRVLSNPVVYYCFYKGAPLVPLSSQINTFYDFSYYFLKRIFQLCLGLPSGPFPQVSLTESCVHFICSSYIPHPSNSPFSMWSPEGYLVKSWSSSLYSFFVLHLLLLR